MILEYQDLPTVVLANDTPLAVCIQLYTTLL